MPSCSLIKVQSASENSVRLAGKPNAGKFSMVKAGLTYELLVLALASTATMT